VTFIVEGKKYRALCQDCKAVSEVIGQVLMVAVVVLAFSSIAVFVFSDEGAVNPPHTPKTDLQESVDTGTDLVKIFHKGGEAIDLQDAKIMLNINGQQEEFDLSSDPGVSCNATNNVLMVGDDIVINTSLSRGRDLRSTDSIDMYFVHTGSDQVIQRVTLQSGNEEYENFNEHEGKGLPEWITPHPKGSAKNEINVSAQTITVDEPKDGQFIEFMPPKDQPGSKYEEFAFGIDASELGINENFKATLRVDYWRHDSSSDKIILELNDGNPIVWVQIKEWEYNGKIGSEKGWVMDTVEIPIENYVSSTNELQNLKIRFVPSTKSGSQNSNKALLIDFVGIHIVNL
jgi:FlaG/FlaF family flagellin (archaellin)